MKTISCTLIIRDEASTLPALISSIRPHVEELVIVDTGSVDDSPAIAKKHADKFEVWTGCNDADGNIVDFSAARNHALELATGDCLAWFDGDDLVRGAESLRKLVSGAPEGAWAYLAPYEYERDADGRVRTLQWRERLVYPRAGFEWRGPVHEGLLGRAGTVPTYMQTDELVVQHEMGRRSTKARDPGRNLRILENHVRKVGETDARNLHYLGAELMYNGRIGEAKYWFRRHAQLSGWSDERALSLLHLAKIALAMGDYAECLEWSLQAIATKSWPEPWWMAGQACCAMAEAGIEPEYNYKRGAHMLQQGFRADTPAAQSLLMKDPTSRYEAHAWLAPCLMKLGQTDLALISAQEGLAGNPKQETLKDLSAQLLTERAKNTVRSGMIELHKLGAIAKEAGMVVETVLRGDFKLERERATYKLSSGPQGHQGGPELGSTTVPRGPAVGFKSQPLDIVFFLGHQMEPWTPRTLEANGMGGSETMAWEMAKRLAAKGNRVRVFAHTEPNSAGGTFDGVRWFDESDFSNVTCDLLICSRRFDAVHHAKYKAAILWVHDVHVGEHFTPRDAVKFDFVWCLSNWHKEFFLSCYPWLNKDKVEVTRNGIDTRRFQRDPERKDAAGGGQVVRNPHRAIYSSSPDRGLAAAVAAWPAVRRAVPDAELHVYYGFGNWEKALAACMNIDHPHCGREAMNQLKLAIAKTPGIVMHGRVNQRELADAMLGAGVWFYPTWFSETSCITAMEAQAAGLVCVCPPIAALAETVDGGGLWLLEPSEHVIRVMTSDSAHKDEPLRAAPQHAERFSLDTLADAWQSRLNKLVQDATANVVPKFHEARNEA